MGQAQSKPSENQLKLGLTKDKQYLVALLPSAYSANATINHEWITRQIELKGHAELLKLEESIDKLIQLYNTHSTISKLIPIAQRVNASASLEISDDKMSVFLTINQAHGGNPIDSHEIHQLLKEHSIIRGIDQEAIDEAVVRGKAEYKLIASGTPVQHGEDAKFVSLLPVIKDRTPKISEDGIVDFRDLGEILVVDENAELMRRIPPTKGTEGYDVLGGIIPPTPGENKIFAEGLVGTTTHPNDRDLLVAATKGQPILVDRGVKVENVIYYKNVSLSTGNVNFDGSVIIEEDVSPGMSIKVSGDIVVMGVVEASNLEAEGDIKIAQSIIGHGDIFDQNGNLKEDASIIKAGGTIEAKYVENARLFSGDSINIQEQVLRCQLEAKNEIRVGGKKSKTGHLIGGSARSGILIHANVFGSPAGAKTHLEISSDEDIHKKIETLNMKIAEVQVEINRKNAILNSPTSDLATFNPELFKKTKIDLGKLERRLAAYVKDKDVLKIEVKRIAKGRIIVEKVIYSSCVVKIGKLQKIINENLKSRTYRVRDNKLISS